MTCKTETKDINEHTYSVTQWPAEKAILMKFKLAKTFGPSIAMMVSESDNDSKALADGLAELFKSASPEDLLALLKETVVGVARDEKRITDSSFSEFFSGDDMPTVYKIFLFVIQVNYSNLLKGQLADRFLAKVGENL